MGKNKDTQVLFQIVGVVILIGGFLYIGYTSPTVGLAGNVEGGSYELIDSLYSIQFRDGGGKPWSLDVGKSEIDIHSKDTSFSFDSSGEIITDKGVLTPPCEGKWVLLGNNQYVWECGGEAVYSQLISGNFDGPEWYGGFRDGEHPPCLDDFNEGKKVTLVTGEGDEFSAVVKKKPEFWKIYGWSIVLHETNVPESEKYNKQYQMKLECYSNEVKCFEQSYLPHRNILGFAIGGIDDGIILNQNYCKDEKVLIQHFCQSNKVDSREYSCGNGCSNDRCNPSYTCKDTDDFNAFNRGSVSTSSYWEFYGEYVEGLQSDYCKYDGSAVFEAYCQTSHTDRVGREEIPCQNGCDQGACIP